MQQCVDADGNPVSWYTYPSIEYLKQFDFSDKRVFEFGCGNSSIWWAERAKQVISVEDNEDWYKSRLKFAKPNLTPHLCQEKDDYCSLILKQEGLFGVIVVDGKYRGECVENAVKKLSPDGMVVFDNTDWVSKYEDYADGIKTLKSKGFFQCDFYGIGPLNNYAWTTSIFVQKDFGFKTLSNFQPCKGVGGI